MCWNNGGDGKQKDKKMEREGEKMEGEGGKVEYNNPRGWIMCNVVTIYLSRRGGMELFRRYFEG